MGFKLPQRVNNYIVIYDIFSDGGDRWASLSNRRRAKISRFLLEYGIRTQKSVFEVNISPAKMNKLVERIRKVARTDRDRIYIYPIECKVVKKIRRFGRNIATLDSIFI
jgi:CRISPR-associated protein Cas2